jgi:type II secretory pathway pseudopilin PulG
MAETGAQEKKTPVWLWVLLGCGGLLAVVMVLGIVAAIAIPSLLAARRATLETNAVGSMRTYANAQVMFHKNDWDGDKVLTYAPSFRALNTTLDATKAPIQLIDSVFAGANSPATPKHGYYFTDMKTIGGKSIDWKNDFALCASPAIYGRTGYRTFIVSTNGTVFGKDLGAGASPPTDFPADPMAEFWIIAE